jgi:hypothetical protein
MSTVRKIFGLACPSCGADDDLRVVVRVVAKLSPDGTDPLGDHDWDEQSSCMCSRCEFTGYVRQFAAPEVLS